MKQISVFITGAAALYLITAYLSSWSAVAGGRPEDVTELTVVPILMVVVIGMSLLTLAGLTVATLLKRPGKRVGLVGGAINLGLACTALGFHLAAGVGILNYRDELDYAYEPSGFTVTFSLVVIMVGAVASIWLAGRPAPDVIQQLDGDD